MTRKKRKPKPVGRPIGSRLRDTMILPMHLAVDAISSSSDRQVQQGAWSELVVYTEAWLRACADRAQVAAVIQGARKVLSLIWERREKSWLPTGDQLRLLRATVQVCDDVLPYLRTDQIQAGLAAVARQVSGGRP